MLTSGTHQLRTYAREGQSGVYRQGKKSRLAPDTYLTPAQCKVLTELFDLGLDIFGRPNGARNCNIARKVGIHSNTCHRALVRLQGLGLVTIENRIMWRLTNVE